MTCALLLTGCPAGQCVRGETRCSADVVQICNADERWESIMDCANTEPGEWQCVEVDTDTEDKHQCAEVTP